MADHAIDAIVPAGGSARRLGGADKPGLLLAGRPLLDHVLLALAEVDRIVIVGDRRPTPVAVSWCREDPPGGGPVAALAAGLTQVRADVVLVVAADLPRIAPAIPLLLAALTGRDAAVVATEGRRNHLAAAWRTASLVTALARLGDADGAAARRLYEDVDLAEVVDTAGWGRDCDTWDDLRELEGAG